MKLFNNRTSLKI